MASLTTSFNATFTPAASDFIVQVTGAGPAELQRKNSSGVTEWPPGDVLMPGAYTISNPVAGAVYRFVKVAGDPVVLVAADQ
jgi:hypothetical protein